METVTTEEIGKAERTLIENTKEYSERYSYVESGDISAEYVSESVGKVKSIKYYANHDDDIADYFKIVTYQYAELNDEGEARITAKLVQKVI